MRELERFGTGAIVRYGHVCQLPATSDWTIGAIFRCDCGRFWILETRYSYERIVRWAHINPFQAWWLIYIRRH